MRVLSNLIWLGLAILLITGGAIFLTDVDKFSVSSKFLTKMVVVGVIILNGAVLSLIVSPKLFKISLTTGQEQSADLLKRLRRWAFALGAISITSWYSALVLGSLDKISLEFSQAFFVYVIILAGAVIVSQIFERIYARRKI